MAPRAPARGSDGPARGSCQTAGLTNGKVAKRQGCQPARLPDPRGGAHISPERLEYLPGAAQRESALARPDRKHATPNMYERARPCGQARCMRAQAGYMRILARNRWGTV